MWRKLSGFIAMYGPLIIDVLFFLGVFGIVIGVYLHD